MNSHPFITQQLAYARTRDLLAAATRRRFVREARAARPIRRPRQDARRPALTAGAPQAHCACR